MTQRGAHALRQARYCSKLAEGKPNVKFQGRSRRDLRHRALLVSFALAQNAELFHSLYTEHFNLLVWSERLPTSKV